jgi:hypothetical protein
LREAVKAQPTQDFFREVIIYDISKRNGNLTKSLSFQLLLALLASVASIPQLWTNGTAFQLPTPGALHDFQQPIGPREKPDQGIETELSVERRAKRNPFAKLLVK